MGKMMMNGSADQTAPPLRCPSMREQKSLFTDADLLLQGYVFPAQFVVGVVGNAINLCVLLSPGMRNRANDFLASMALADIAFFLAMLPHSLATHDFFYASDVFRRLYLSTRMHLVGLSNWASAAAIWFILGVSIERLLVIRSPLRSQLYWKRWQKLTILLSIFVATGLLTSYTHFAYYCRFYTQCNGTQLWQYCIGADLPVLNYLGHNRTHLKNPFSAFHQKYVGVNIVANALFAVLLPIVAVAGLNIALIHYLHQRSAEPLLSTADSAGRSDEGRAQQLSQERRVTTTVRAIVSCFSLTQGPSALINMWKLAQGYGSHTTFFYVLLMISNSLVATGKALNFVLFCFSSVHFRRKALRMTTRRLNKLPVRWPSWCQSLLQDHLQRKNTQSTQAAHTTLETRLTIRGGTGANQQQLHRALSGKRASLPGVLRDSFSMVSGGGPTRTTSIENNV